MDLIFFGMQGSGKGTQAKILAKRYGYKIFETGGELRNIAASDSDLGRKVHAIMNEGHLVDTSVIMEIIEDFLEHHSADKIIFDGIPRSMEQFVEFEKLMEKHEKKPLGVNIKLTKEAALNRLLRRFNCVGVDMTDNPLMSEEECVALGGEVARRSDDTEEAISTRIDTFFRETQPVIDKYLEVDRMFEIEGDQEVDDVTDDLIKGLEL